MNSWMCGSGEISARDLGVICADIANKVMGKKGDDPKKMCRPKEKRFLNFSVLLTLSAVSLMKLKAPFFRIMISNYIFVCVYMYNYVIIYTHIHTL